VNFLNPLFYNIFGLLLLCSGGLLTHGHSAVSGSQTATSGSLSTISQKTDSPNSSKNNHNSAPLFETLPIKAIIERGELIVAMHRDDHSPFHMQSKKGELIGVDIEVAEKIARALNVKLRFDRSYKNFDAVVDAVSAGVADIGISKLSFTINRSKKVIFSIPYFTLHKAVLISRRVLSKIEGNMTIKDVVSLKDVKLGVIKESSYVDFAKEMFPDTKLVECLEEDRLKMLSSGEINAFFRDNNDLGKLLRKNPDLNLFFAVYSIEEQVDPLYVVTGIKNSNLIGWINAILANSGAAESQKEIFTKYKDDL